MDGGDKIHHLLGFNSVVVIICFIIYIVAPSNITEVSIFMVIYVLAQIMCILVSVVIGIKWIQDKIVGPDTNDLRCFLVMQIIPSVAGLIIQSLKYKEKYMQVLVSSNRISIILHIFLIIYAIVFVICLILERIKLMRYLNNNISNDKKVDDIIQKSCENMDKEMYEELGRKLGKNNE